MALRPPPGAEDAIPIDSRMMSGRCWARRSQGTRARTAGKNRSWPPFFLIGPSLGGLTALMAGRTTASGGPGAAAANGPSRVFPESYLSRLRNAKAGAAGPPGATRRPPPPGGGGEHLDGFRQTLLLARTGERPGSCKVPVLMVGGRALIW